MTTEHKLSDLADTLIESYWILCEPADVVARAIEEFTTFAKLGRPFMYGDDQVSAEELLHALTEVIEHFESRNIWPTIVGGGV